MASFSFCPSCGKSIPANMFFCPSCGKAIPSVTQPTQPSQASPQSVIQSRASQSGSHAGRNIGILFVLLLLFFFLPIIPFTFASYSFLGGNAQATGDVSMSFAMFHCGMVVNVQASGSFAGYTVGSYSEGNPGFVCNGSG